MQPKLDLLLFPFTISAMNQSLVSLIEKLNWNDFPKLSPYQWAAWRAILTFPPSEAIPALEAKREELSKLKGYFPHNYAAAFKRSMNAGKVLL